MPYYDDDGKEFFPELHPRPMLCLTCGREERIDFVEDVLCNLTRLDQRDEPEFYCGAWEPSGRPDCLPGFAPA